MPHYIAVSKEGDIDVVDVTDICSQLNLLFRNLEIMRDEILSLKKRLPPNESEPKDDNDDLLNLDCPF